MKTAEELYKISKAQTPILVAKVLEGVREHIIERCEQEAMKGGTYYSIHLKKEYGFIKQSLLEECIKLAKEFENNGYKVSIEDSGNGYYVNFTMRFSWNGKVFKSDGRCFDHNEFLYDTDIGIVK